MRDFILGLVGGTALLMTGVDMMGDGLERSVGNAMKSILAALTGTVYRAILVSTVLTALVQSSTAITVLTVGFVNAGLMTLSQAVGVIYGANIGTTVTAQLMAFKLTDWAFLFVGVGFVTKLAAKSDRWRNLGSALMGFGLMFTGLKILNSGVPFLQQHPAFVSVLNSLTVRPLVGIVIGMLATMLVHSSAATVAVTMVLAKAGLIDLTGAVCLMLGDNIGTCVTAQVASLTTNVNARRTAWAHTLYNVIGVAAVFTLLPWFVRLTSSTSPDIARQIANSHTVFNVLSALAFLPFTKPFVRLLERLVPGRAGVKRATYLDELLIPNPPSGLKAARAEIVEMAKLLRIMCDRALSLVSTYDSKLAKQFSEDEALLNGYQKRITKYLMNISRQPLIESESRLVSSFLAIVNDVERIGDRFDEIARLALRRSEERTAFSATGLAEVARLRDEAVSLMASIPPGIEESHLDTEKGRQLVSDTVTTARDGHVRRLQQGICTVDAGVIFFDILSHIETVLDFVRDIERSVLAA
ncbi:MAG: Na/Pi cotransporter family protein [Bacillota bacterium]|nr:Na/Pi cotransporter family protein [Bacillota bacterium]